MSFFGQASYFCHSTDAFAAIAVNRPGEIAAAKPTSKGMHQVSILGVVSARYSRAEIRAHYVRPPYQPDIVLSLFRHSRIRDKTSLGLPNRLVHDGMRQFRKPCVIHIT